MFNSTGIKVAIGSFGIGVSILFLFILTGWEGFVAIGLCYLFIATIINIITILYLLVNAFMNRENVQINAMTCFVILLNIPLAWLCAYIGLSNF